MDEPVKKRVDESWKQQAEQEKRTGEPAAPKQPGAPGVAGGPVGAEAAEAGTPEAEGLPQARFDMFVSGLAMEALIALGDMPHPGTKKQMGNLPQAKYLVDLLGLLEEKTRGNLSVDEERLLKDALYQLRMRYLAKSGAS